MPLMVRARNAAAPAPSYLTTSQTIYENTYVPYQDFKKDVCEQDAYEAAIEESAQEEQQFQREVPYYTEEDVFPETFCDAEVHADVPDMLQEMRPYFTNVVSNRWMPPPPPVSAVTTLSKSMRCWYAHLLETPVYNACVSLISAACPAPQDASDDQEWTRMCSQWWDCLSDKLQYENLTEIPVRWSRNPYSLEHCQSYEMLSKDKLASPAQPNVDASAARFPAPPPPSFDDFCCQYDAALPRYEVEALFVRSLQVWWRMACEWSMAASLTRSWLCPPPTTEETPASWGAALDHWWRLTMEEIRVEDDKKRRRARAEAHETKLMVEKAARQQTPESYGLSLSTESCEPVVAHQRCRDAQNLW